jgi:uncharacterized small protein (DUF1192 family)
VDTPTNAEVMNNHADVLEELVEVVDNHADNIALLLEDVARLKAEVALLRQELSYVRPVPSLRHGTAEIQPHVSPGH